MLDLLELYESVLKLDFLEKSEVSKELEVDVLLLYLEQVEVDVEQDL